MHHLTQKIIDTGERANRNERSRKIVKLCLDFTYQQRLRMLDSAIDRQDMERVNLLLDAVQADYKSRQLSAMLPPEVLQELHQHAPPRHEGHTDNDAG